jgi:hypothetical protein
MAVAKLEIYSYASIVPLSYYETELSKDNPFRFQYMTPEQRAFARVRLLNTLVAMRIDAQNHMERGRKLKLKQRAAELQKCCDLLYSLDYLDDPIRSNAGRDCPLGYLGLYAHLDLMKPKTDPNDPKQVENLVNDIQYFANQVKALDDPMNDDTDKTRQLLGQFNGLRLLHWVAGVSTAQAILDFVWNEQHYRSQYQNQFDSASTAFSTPMGFISVFLFYFRLFAVELKEAIQQARSKWEPVKSTGVRLPDEGAWTRFKADVFGMRKYIILNDILWGTANLLAFLWLRSTTDVAVKSIFGLKGNPALGFAGNLLMLAFLVMDVILTFARYMELKKQFNTDVLDLEKEAEGLSVKIIDIENHLRVSLEVDDQAALKNQLNYLKATKRQAEEAITQLKFNWRYQKYKLWAELGYTSSLVLSFGLMCIIMFTGVVFSGLLLGVIGAAAWFIMTLVYNGVNAAIEHSKIKATVSERRMHAEGLLEEFNTADSEYDKQGLYVQIKELLAKNDHEKSQAAFLWKKVAVQSFAHALVPVILFCATVLMPWGWGLLLLGVFAALLYAGKRILDSWEPKKNDMKFFPSFGADHPLHLAYEKQFDGLKAQQERGKTLTLMDFEDTVTPAIPRVTSSEADSVDDAVYGRLGYRNFP